MAFITNINSNLVANIISKAYRIIYVHVELHYYIFAITFQSQKSKIRK